MSKEIMDLQSFPILTEEVDLSSGLRPGGGSSSGGTLEAVVERSLREILGWRPRKSDPKGFLTALKQSFRVTTIEGREEWGWNPHSYAVQADLGAVTGAQASLYKRAKSALEEALPLLEGLTALRTDADDEDVEASRAIIESNWTELVNEIGYVGGPRVQRVETLFDLLLGPGFTDTDPEQVQGQLGRLRERLGLDRTRVNTIEEEQNLTNFLILADYTISLKQSWLAQQRFLGRSDDAEVFLGTQVTLLNRALAALAESVQQAYDVLDSVFISAAERETIRLRFNGNEPALTIAELLQWTEYVAQEEGPRLIREGGRDGALALAPTLQRVTGLLERAWLITRQPSDNPTQGFHTPRVQRTFQELVLHSRQAVALADGLQPSPLCHTLTVEIKGIGRVFTLDGQLDCTGQCSALFPQGTVVMLIAQQAYDDPPFDHWEVDGCVYKPDRWQDSNQIAIAVTRDSTVKAIFKDTGGRSGGGGATPGERQVVRHWLEVVVDGEGSVTISAPDGETSVLNRSTLSYPHGTIVMLTAKPEPAARFKYWRIGSRSISDDQISFDMDETLTVTAHFTSTTEGAASTTESRAFAEDATKTAKPSAEGNGSPDITGLFGLSHEEVAAIQAELRALATVRLAEASAKHAATGAGGKSMMTEATPEVMDALAAGDLAALAKAMSDATAQSSASAPVETAGVAVPSSDEPANGPAGDVAGASSAEPDTPILQHHIRGVGEATARRLWQAGVRTVEDLANMKAEDLQEIIRGHATPAANPADWIDQARAYQGRAGNE